MTNVYIRGFGTYQMDLPSPTVTSPNNTPHQVRVSNSGELYAFNTNLLNTTITSVETDPSPLTSNEGELPPGFSIQLMGSFIGLNNMNTLVNLFNQDFNADSSDPSAHAVASSSTINVSPTYLPAGIYSVSVTWRDQLTSSTQHLFTLPDALTVTPE